MKRIHRTVIHIRRTLLVLLSAASLLCAGCRKEQPAAHVDRSVLPASVRALSYKKHMDISIGYWDIDDCVKATKPDGMMKYIEKLFNVTIRPVSVSWANYKKRYEILSATHNLPDVFADITLSSSSTEDSAAFAQMIEDDSIRALPQDLSAYPTLNSFMDSISYTKYTDGKFYAIPRISYSDISFGSTDAAMIVRKDWMDALHLSDPVTFDDFADLTAAFTHDDPDGDGKDDTVGYNVNALSALGKWVMLGIAPQCNAYSWIEQDGRYVPSWTTDAFTDVVKAYRRLYETGGLDPDFYTKTPASVLEDFATGRLGAFEYKSAPGSLWALKRKWEAVNDKPFADCVKILPALKAPDGIRYSNSSSRFWSESYISSNTSDAKLKRILALYEFLLSDAGQDFCHYGIKDTDYKIAKDGTYESLLGNKKTDFSTALSRKYPSATLFSGIASWGCAYMDFDNNKKNDLRYGSDVSKLSRDAYAYNCDNTTQITRPYAFLSFPKEPSDLFGTSQAQKTFIDCITGSGDPADMWNESLADMRSKGLDGYIDKQNENYSDSSYQQYMHELYHK